MKTVFLNPILHGGGHFVPAHIDNPLWLHGGYPKWAQISWLCSFQHSIGPIEAIFQQKNLKVSRSGEKNFYQRETKGEKMEKFN